jgi:drug/metabolite transporter (DMT)-like permease
VVVFLLYLVVLRYWAASRASYGFVIIPFVTVVLSASLDDEPVGVGLVLGGLLVLAGVYVGALRPARTHPAALDAKTDMDPSTAASGAAIFATPVISCSGTSRHPDSRRSSGVPRMT